MWQDMLLLELLVDLALHGLVAEYVPVLWVGHIFLVERGLEQNMILVIEFVLGMAFSLVPCLIEDFQW